MTGDYESDDGLLVRYARLIMLLVLAILVLVGAALSILNLLFEIDPIWDSYWKAVGGAIIASVIVYILLAVFVDPRRQEIVVRRTSSFAVSVAQAQFNDTFKLSIPRQTFDDSQGPRPSFRLAFAAALDSSKSYDFKGSDGSFTSFRLSTLKNKAVIRSLENVRLCLVDPRDARSVRAYAEMQISREEPNGDFDAMVRQEEEKLRAAIFATLVGLFDIRSQREVYVYLHSDLPYFRCEIFDESLFLTYYAGSAEYPQTLQFDTSTRQYRAYQRILEITRRHATCFMIFGSQGPSADLVRSEAELQSRLQELGCTDDLQLLRSRFAEREKRLLDSIKKSGISSDSTF